MQTTIRRPALLPAAGQETRSSEPEAQCGALIVHPAPEDLEEYYFARFDWQQRQTIESHLAHCDSCVRELGDLQEFVAGLSRVVPGCGQSRSEKTDTPALTLV